MVTLKHSAEERCKKIIGISPTGMVVVISVAFVLAVAALAFF